MSVLEIALAAYDQIRHHGRSTGLDRVSPITEALGRNEKNEVTPPVAAGQATSKPLFSFDSFFSYSELDVIPVSEDAAVPQVVVSVRQSTKPVGLDIETTGLDPSTDRIRLLQIAVESRIFVIDLFALPSKDCLSDLFDVLSCAEAVGHNLQFDLRFLAKVGFVPGKLYDTMLASQVLHAGQRSDDGKPMRHGLKEVVARELGGELDKAAQTSNWMGELTEEQVRYAARDAAVVMPLATRLRMRLAQKKLTPVAELEMRALPGIAWANRISFDQASWLDLAKEAASERDRLAGELHALDRAGKVSNWTSPVQVKEALKKEGIEVESTADESLASIDHPIARTLRRYREATKRTSTYGEKWVAKHASGDGRIYPSWRQIGTETGRMSCSSPNLQQIPKHAGYRRCFIASPGRVLIKADYSQIELRIAARIANEPRMLQAYQNGEDLHRLTAAALLGKAPHDIDKNDRQLAKAINFGLLFGMGAKSLVNHARRDYGVNLTEEEATSHRNKFFQTYPELSKWHRSAGGRRPTDTRTLAGRHRLAVDRFTEKLNSPVQGTGADGLKAAIAFLWERRSECPSAVPVIFAHDEIVIECDEDDVENAKQWLKKCMTDGMAPLIRPVPVEVEIATGRSWAGTSGEVEPKERLARLN